MGIIRKNNASIFLFINAFLWGSSYVWSKMLLGYLPRFTILFICALGGMVSTVIMFRSALKGISFYTIAASVVVSLFSVISNTFFMFALQYTSSSNTAFIVQTSVIITPVIMAILERKVPQRKIVVSAAVALAGLFMLTCDFSHFRLNAGDLLALGNALFFSLFLIGMKVNSKKVDPVHFTFIHHTTNTVAFLGLASIFEMSTINLKDLKSPIFLGLIFASVLVAVVTVLVQSAAIKFVRPEKATLIYTFEPVTAMLLAYIFIGETFNGWMPVAGCAVILLSVVYSLYKPRVRRKRVFEELDQNPSAIVDPVLELSYSIKN